jgi:iron complex transport system substrate-binding protein
MHWKFCLILLFALCACSTPEAAEDADVSDSIALKIEYAEHFNLEKKDGHYLLHILDPEKGTKEHSYTIETGTSRRLLSLTSTLNGMLSILESTDQLCGISSAEYLYDAAIRKRFDQGFIQEFGDETALSVEKIVASKANTVLFSGFGDAFPHSAQLEKLGVELIPIYDWRETHPLGKAEWIKVVGILVGKEKEAVAFFEKVKKEYAKIQALAKSVQSRPSVLAGNLYADVWYTPAGQSYMAQLMHDAGALYTHANTRGTGSAEFTMEQILALDRETEFWINPGISSKARIDQLMPHAKHLKAYAQIYCYSPNLNKYWERSAAEPHLLLSDLIHIFHPEIEEIQHFHFYAKIE